MNLRCRFNFHSWKEEFNYEPDVPRYKDRFWGEQYTYVRKCRRCTKREFWVNDLGSAWLDESRITRRLG